MPLRYIAKTRVANEGVDIGDGDEDMNMPG
jgi:hypothetical protein